MSNFVSGFKAFVADENGVTAIEYGLIAALVGLVVAGGATLLGKDISNVFGEVGKQLANKAGITPAT